VPPKREPKPVNSDANVSGFEQEFARLGSIVERLEGGNLALEDMLKLYEEGIQLSQRLNRTLTDAELHVKKLALMHEELSHSAMEDVLESSSPEDDDPF
jgi:exodeoxyribonuclease VII small subunit